jgi:hypothetical protein
LKSVRTLFAQARQHRAFAQAVGRLSIEAHETEIAAMQILSMKANRLSDLGSMNCPLEDGAERLLPVYNVPVRFGLFVLILTSFL